MSRNRRTVRGPRLDDSYPLAEDRTQPESSGVGEQEYSRNDDREIVSYRREPIAGQVIGAPSRIPGWQNPFTQVVIAFSVDTTSIRILPANFKRTYLLIQNKSADVIYVNFGQNATVLGGVLISAGGAYELIGGAVGGSHVPADDIYIIGGSVGLLGVVVEGMLVAR